MEPIPPQMLSILGNFNLHILYNFNCNLLIYEIQNLSTVSTVISLCQKNVQNSDDDDIRR